jgi:hypothetical protein
MYPTNHDHFIPNKRIKVFISPFAAILSRLVSWQVTLDFGEMNMEIGM